MEGSSKCVRLFFDFFISAKFIPDPFNASHSGCGTFLRITDQAGKQWLSCNHIWRGVFLPAYFIERCLFQDSRWNIYTLFLPPKCPQIIARRKRSGRSAKNPAVGAKVKSTGLQLLGQTEAAEQSEWQVGNNSYESPAVLWITTCWEDIARSVILRIGAE